MSLLSSLPAPRQAVGPQHAAPAAAPAVTTLAIVGSEPPPYGRRSGFVPRKDADFGGGGAFPEVHVAQYPLGMGRPDAAKGGKTLAVSVKEDGQVDYDAILRQGSNRNKIIHSGHKALVPKLDELDPKVSLRGRRAAAAGFGVHGGGSLCTSRVRDQHAYVSRHLASCTGGSCVYTSAAAGDARCASRPMRRPSPCCFGWRRLARQTCLDTP